MRFKIQARGIKKTVLGVLFSWTVILAFAQAPQVDPALLKQAWPAQWVTDSSFHLKAYEVLHLRKTLELAHSPVHFIVHISADSRYKFYVNGHLAGMGPARSDLAHWKYETYDLAPFLKAGKNLLAALIWNQGEYNAFSQHSARTAFLLQGNSALESPANTGPGWKCLKDVAFQPIVFAHSDKRLFWQYYVAGAMDSLNTRDYPWDWEQPSFDDSAWRGVKYLGKAQPRGTLNDTPWDLVPSGQARLDLRPGRLVKLVRVNGNVSCPAGFPQSKGDVVVKPHSHVSLLVDNGLEVTAYPRLSYSGGKNSSMKISYAEALLKTERDHPYRWHKGNRNETDGKNLYGVYDRVLPDGSSKREFSPLWMRVFRFIQLDMETGADSLVIHDLDYQSVMYPFQNLAHFETGDSLHSQIFAACDRTIRLASQETYIDPYFEQMQYVGDTRLQALYASSHYADDRLTRNAISQFAWSQNTDGLTMSRYPSELPQYSPIFSLCWALMVKDYWMLRGDEAYCRSFLPQILSVFRWYSRQVNSEGMLGDLPYLDFLDTFYPRDQILAHAKSRTLTPYALFFVYTVRQLEPLFRAAGKSAEFREYDLLAERIRRQVIHTCFDPRRGLMADNPDRNVFSQHATAMALLTGCIPLEQKEKAVKALLNDTSLIQTSIYFKFYVFAALVNTGHTAEILDQLQPWQTMLANGLHTFSEWVDDPRSECHSWSAYPSFYFLSAIAGINPASPGFKTVHIKPAPGKLHYLSASTPHPDGLITLNMKLSPTGSWQFSILLPKGVTGVLDWQGQEHVLHGGRNEIKLQAL